MELSRRLYAVAGLVTPGNRLADVGTDHGYIPIYLMEQGLIPHGIAMDVNAGPLERAREHIREHGLEEKIETRLSDGLREIEAGEADTVVIAGMGGALTIRILEEGFRILPSLKEWFCSPDRNSQSEKLACDRGYCIEREDMVEEEGNIIPCSGRIWEAKTGHLRPEEALYGPLLLQNRHPVLLRYLQKERERKKGILAQIESRGAQTPGNGGRSFWRRWKKTAERFPFFCKTGNGRMPEDGIEKEGKE